MIIMFGPRTNDFICGPSVISSRRNVFFSNNNLLLNPASNDILKHLESAIKKITGDNYPPQLHYLLFHDVSIF